MLIYAGGDRADQTIRALRAALDRVREITHALGALRAPPDGEVESFSAGPQSLRVAFEPFVYVRRAPLITAPVARECAAGATVWADARWGAWLRVSAGRDGRGDSESGWVLGAHPLHGRLIELVEEGTG